MSNYAERRDAGIAKTLAAIDAVTRTCMVCGQPVPRHGALDLFCSVACHRAGLRYSARPAALTEHPPSRIPAAIREQAARRFTQDPQLRRDIIGDGLSIVAATIDSMDAVTADIAAQAAERQRVAAQAARARQHRIDRATHASHTREMRGAIATGVIAFCAAVLAVSYLIDASWIAAGITTAVAAASGSISWMSWSNARTEAAACSVCHPPCDTRPTG